MSQFPSPADTASSSSSSGFQLSSPKNTPKLYPDLSTGNPDEDDVLTAMGAPPPRSKRPPRPPPPRSQSLPDHSPILTKPRGTADAVARSLPPSSQAHHQYTKSNSEGNLLCPQPLHPHEIRWFYQETGKYWTPFNGHDSLVLEEHYRRVQNCLDEENSTDDTSVHEVAVLGDMYVVNLGENTCKPIYWTGSISAPN